MASVNRYMVNEVVNIRRPLNNALSDIDGGLKFDIRLNTRFLTEAGMEPLCISVITDIKDKFNGNSLA